MGEKLAEKPFVVMPPILLGVLAFFLSLAWIVPNHSRPWLAFYSDAIAAIVLLFVAFWVLIRTPRKLELNGVGLFFLALAAIPWIQFVFGEIYSFGTAWINSLFLIGFSFVIFTGWHWEKLTPGQCLDFLFLAIVLAAVVSVGMQGVQWLQPGSDDFWINRAGSSRFYANMGQPNQLASLLLLAVLGGVWAYTRKTLGAVVTILLILYLLFGVALTESRTAWLNIAGILIALYFCWGESRPKFFNVALLGFGAYFLTIHLSLPVINDLLLGKVVAIREIDDPIRLGMWKSLVKAAIERPWFGYGWGQTTEAALASADFPDTGAVTKHSHNIFLEIVIYNGILFGVLIVAVVAAMFWRFLGCLKQDHFIVPALAVGLLLVHAMLELPLHYAYFLLPFGMILGVLVRCCDLKVRVVSPKWTGYGFAIAVAFALWITVTDCLEIERTYFNVYFGKKGQAIPPEAMPELSVLTQWRDRLVFANEIPGSGGGSKSYRWMKGVIVATPETFLMFQMAQNMALNGHPDEAKEWLLNMCKMAPAWVGQDLAGQWEVAAKVHPAYREVDWRNCPGKYAQRSYVDYYAVNVT